MAETSFLLGLACLIPVLWLLFFYYPKGNLSVEVTDQAISFSFDKKLLFNHRHIPCISINDIKYVVIDQQIMLKKIYTKNNGVIRLGITKILRVDSQEFIDELKAICSHNNIKVTDSWGEWKERGFLQKAYQINRILVGVAIVVVLVLSIAEGFEPKYLFGIIPLLLQAILYGRAIKDTLNKT